MTTILGVQHKNGLTLAADLQITSGDRSYIHPDLEKIVKVGHLLVACAGSARFADVALNLWKPPTYVGDMSEYKFMVSKIIPSLRNTIETNGVTLKDDEQFQALIGFNGKLFEVATDYTVLVSNSNFYGIGSGSAYGIGALAAGADIETAVKISAKFDINTGGKIQVIKQGAENATRRIPTSQ
jgi:ATP-dependent protease HslVU (ClpYQ) peptidase subunit